MSEKINFTVPGISKEEIDTVRQEGQRENKENLEKGTGVKGKTLNDAINLKI